MCVCVCVSVSVGVGVGVCDVCEEPVLSPQSKVVIELLETLLDADIPPASIGNY